MMGLKRAGSGGLQASLVGNTEKQKRYLMNSLDDASSLGGTRPNKRIFGKLQRN